MIDLYEDREVHTTTVSRKGSNAVRIETHFRKIFFQLMNNKTLTTNQDASCFKELELSKSATDCVSSST